MPTPHTTPNHAKLPQNGPLRVGMIGGGINSAVGRVHEIAMKMDNQFSLQAGCFSRNKAINHESGKAYGVDGDRIYTSAQAMLHAERGKLDVIVIATPMNSHAQYIHMALDLGFAVISDKPLVSSIEDGVGILNRLPKQSAQVFCMFNYTGFPMVREMRAMVELGKIGQVFKVMVEMPQDSYMRLFNQQKTANIQSWRLQDADIDCVTLDLFIHLHALVDFVCQQKPMDVFAHSRSISKVSEGLIDEVDAIIRYHNNLTVNAWYGKAALGHRNGLSFRVYGNKGSLQWQQINPEILWFTDAEGNTSVLDRISNQCTVASQPRYQRFKAGHPAGFIEAFANCYTDIGHAIKQGLIQPYTPSIGTAIDGLKLAYAISLSAQSQQLVPMQLVKEIA